MSRSYKKTPSISETWTRKKVYKKIYKKSLRNKLKNGIELANGGAYKIHAMEDRWDYIDYCSSARACSLAKWIDWQYESYLHEVEWFDFYLELYEKKIQRDVSDERLAEVKNLLEKATYDNAVYDWSSNFNNVREKYRDIFFYFDRKRSALESEIKFIEYIQEYGWSKRPEKPVWDRKKVEQEYKKLYIYK